MRMKVLKNVFSLLIVTFMTVLFVPSLMAQVDAKSSVITEYNGKQYYIHTVQKKQSLQDIADIYDVSLYEIMKENKDVKRNPKAGTIIRVPYHEKIVIEEVVAADTLVENEEDIEIVEDFVPVDFNSERLYKVALMMPLYLEQVDEEFLDLEPTNKQLLAKPFSYLHFYEGFMIAVDSMVSSLDMKIELKVFDVDQDTNKVVNALNDTWLVDADIIVGPFHLKSFDRVMKFAEHHDIMIVNPMTPRDDLVRGHENMVKVKPSRQYQMQWLEQLMKDKYTDNNIFIFAMDSSCMNYAHNIKEIAERNVNEYSLVPNSHINKVIKKHHDAWKIEEVDFDEDRYDSDNVKLDVRQIKSFPDDSTMLKNQVRLYNYSIDSLNKMKKVASTIRNNVVIAYGDSRVFATEIVNKVNMLTERFPVNLIVLPDWSNYDKLFNENLMKMKTVFFDEEYTDYNTFAVGMFICKFRDKYVTEPDDLAYHGFNVGWYFLNALMNYGDNIKYGIINYDIPLLNTRYNFKRKNADDGVENTYWNIYQHIDYDKKQIQYE